MLQPRLYFSFVVFELANDDTKRPVLRSSLKTFNTTRASGGFLVSCVELGIRGFSKFRAVKQLLSNSLKNREETGTFAGRRRCRDQRQGTTELAVV